MKNKLSFVVAFFVASMVFVFTSCYKDDNETVLNVFINDCPEKHLTVGDESFKLNVEVETGIDRMSRWRNFKKPDKVELDTTVEWESDNTNVVTVDQNGRVTVIGPGWATISVISVMNGRGFGCYVEVVEAPEATE